MSYILIWVVIWNSGHMTSGQAEFNSKTSCIKARAQLQLNLNGVNKSVDCYVK